MRVPWLASRPLPSPPSRPPRQPRQPERRAVVEAGYCLERSIPAAIDVRAHYTPLFSSEAILTQVPYSYRELCIGLQLRLVR